MSDSPLAVGIAGLGHFLPERVVDNNYFTRFVDTSDEWIVQRTGIRERRWLDDHEKPSDMYIKAAERALADSKLAAEDIDLIVLATVSGDFQGVPATSCLVQEALGCRNAAAFDIQAACAGFLYAMQIGRQFIANRTYRNVLIIGGEALSRISDIYDRNSVILFADGAGSAVLQAHEECKQGLIEDMVLGADGSGKEFIMRPRGGAAEPMTPEILNEGTSMIRMRGREVYRFAVSRMTELMAWAMEGQDMAELGLIVPHQVNRRILETACEKLGVDPSQVFINIDKYGNTSAASVPIALNEARAEGLLEPGKLVVLAAFGAGLVWGAARLRW